MISSDYTLSRPVAVSIPAEEIDKLLRAGDGQCALVYLALQRTGGRPLRPGALGLTETQLREAMEKLAALGLVSSGRRAQTPSTPLPAPDELPEYTAEDLVRRVREDLNFQSLVAFTEQCFGRKLTTPETKTLLGMQDYLGLGSESRINTPGTAEGNWAWRVDAAALTEELADSIRDLTATFARCAPKELAKKEEA